MVLRCELILTLSPRNVSKDPFSTFASKKKSLHSEIIELGSTLNNFLAKVKVLHVRSINQAMKSAFARIKQI